MQVRVGDKFSKEAAFTVKSIRQFASYVGDTNPLHHDQAAAAASPFGQIIASGTHTFSLMIAAVPNYFAASRPNLGLEASVKMLRPVRAGDKVCIEWTVTEVTRSQKLKGWIVTMSGRLVRDDGVVAMTAVAKSLLR
jgi:acyl dehydratase